MKNTFLPDWLSAPEENDTLSPPTEMEPNWEEISRVNESTPAPISLERERFDPLGTPTNRETTPLPTSQNLPSQSFLENEMDDEVPIGYEVLDRNAVSRIGLTLSQKKEEEASPSISEMEEQEESVEMPPPSDDIPWVIEISPTDFPWENSTSSTTPEPEYQSIESSQKIPDWLHESHDLAPPGILLDLPDPFESPTPCKNENSVPPPQVDVKPIPIDLPVEEKVNSDIGRPKPVWDANPKWAPPKKAQTNGTDHSWMDDINEKNSEIIVGQTFGKFLITESVGEGAFGRVFRAFHQKLQIPVALKVINPALLAKNPRVLEQLKSEALLMARINHPNIVRVWDFEENPHLPFLVLEYVEGFNLAEMLKFCGRLMEDRALRAVLQVTQGLAAAWKHGIVHRDVKPGNIFFSREGTVKIGDLGLAMVAGAESEKDKTNIAGTPAYIAPEQCTLGNEVDHRADIYSLGATFYHMLTGQIPFGGNSQWELLQKHQKENVIPPQQVISTLSMGVSNLVVKMMEKNPQDRFQTYEELLRELSGLIRNGKRKTTPLPQ